MSDHEHAKTIRERAKLIRFYLNQLAAQNGHHEFERLAMAYARARIADNLLPATGPVSAGGDQGRDFETFRTYIVPEAGVQKKVAGERLSFACTIQRDNIAAKIRQDVRNTMSPPAEKAGPVPSGIYIFTVADVPVALRHTLQGWAKNTYGIDLEIFDGQALAEDLATDRLYSIAVAYLHLPRELSPPALSVQNEMYEALRRALEGILPAPSGPKARQFADGAPRVASELSSDLELARILTSVVVRRSTYEEVAAAVGFSGQHSGTPLDRWASLVAFARSKDQLDNLIRAIRNAIPPAVRYRVAAAAPQPRRERACAGDLSTESRGDVQRFLHRLAACVLGVHVGPGEAPHAEAARYFGRLVLAQVWGGGEPGLPVTAAAAGPVPEACAKMATQAHLDGLLDAGEDGAALRDWHNPVHGTAIAADALTSELECGGEEAAEWLRSVLACSNDGLGVARMEVLRRVVEWWPDARPVIVASQELLLSRDPTGISAPEQETTLVRLSRADVLLDAAAAPGTSIATASFRWARKAGLERYLAWLLEYLDERNPNVYLGLLDEVASDVARRALARSARWLLEDGADPAALRDGPYRNAILACLASAPREQIRTLVRDSADRACWLRILSPPLSEAQCAALDEISRNDYGGRRRREAEAARALLKAGCG